VNGGAEETAARENAPALSVIRYDQNEVQEFSGGALSGLPENRAGGVTWINLNYLDAALVNALAGAFAIHPLTVEDILDTRQRPKAEEFETYLFLSLKAIHRAGEDHGYEQISIILMNNTVLTFQERPGDNFDGIRKRIRNSAGRIRRMGADYLAYALVDAVVDEYFIILDALGDEIEDFEERAAGARDADFITSIQRIRRQLFTLRKSVWPLRDSVSHIIHSDADFFGADLEPFLKDLYDHTLQASDTVESCREIIAGVMEVNLSTASNGMNKIMKVLTIISTIFIPLTFIAGVYGMNFRFMPELGWPYGYPAIMGVMILTAAGMLVYFRRRRWM
jgi:magnesium transporter